VIDTTLIIRVVALLVIIVQEPGDQILTGSLVTCSNNGEIFILIPEGSVPLVVARGVNGSFSFNHTLLDYEIPCQIVAITQITDTVDVVLVVVRYHYLGVLRRINWFRNRSESNLS
jgi:hypothetical protein